MRRVSKKRRKLNDEVREWRQNKVNEVGKCEMSGFDSQSCTGMLGVHEIGSGHTRSLFLSEACGVLVLCYGHNQFCHSIPKETQLALLKLNRPEDYDYDRFCSIRQKWYDKELIEQWRRDLAQHSER